MAANGILVHLANAWALPHAKQLPHVGKTQVANRGHLEFQKCVLARIQIDGFDPARPCQEIRERITTAAGDHQHAVGPAQIQRFAIDGGIFTASIVNERSSVYCVKATFVESHARRL